jgi:hypothetical protein
MTHARSKTVTLTVACTLVRGNVDYSDEYVLRLRSMVERHLSVPHRFVCLSDRDVPGVDCRRIAAPVDMPGWWAKLNYFNRDVGLAGRVIMMDLDVLVMRSIDALGTRMPPFAAVPHAGTFEGSGGKRVVKRINSSVMITQRIEKLQWLYDEWLPAHAREYWGDQDYIGDRLEDIQLLPLEWFPRLSEVRRPPWPMEAKVVLCKVPKNHVACETMPWVREVWR